MGCEVSNPSQWLLHDRLRRFTMQIERALFDQFRIPVLPTLLQHARSDKQTLLKAAMNHDATCVA